MADTSTITSAILNPSPTIPYVMPKPTPVPSVDGLDSSGNLTLTQPEKQASDLSTRLQALNDSLVGKSAFQNDQETEAGIPQLRTTQNDLKTQLLQLTNEAKAIPNQLQLDATGRGVTAGGLAPIQSGALRENAIKALNVSSLLDATNGLLASAQDKVDRAAKAKYDPIQEEIDAATKNLDLILKSPNATVADKNRANAQLQLQKQKQDQLDQDKQNTKDVNAVALEAAKNGADAATLQKIMATKNQAEAIAAAGDSLKTPSTQVVDLNGTKTLVDTKTGATIKVLSSPSSGPGETVAVSDGKGGQLNIPVDVAPYYNTSSSGVPYVDASTLQGTAGEKKNIVDAAQKAGLKVILNKNTAADLSNISDANNKLDTISQIMQGIDQPGPLSRALYGIGLTKLATMAQTNPQQAAADSLRSVGLDMLKAISGVQGFRGNATVVQQINDHLPSIYDTNAVAQQKLDYIRQLISDRENGLLGVQKTSTPTYKGITLPGGSSNSGSTYNGITLPH